MCGAILMGLRSAPAPSGSTISRHPAPTRIAMRRTLALKAHSGSCLSTTDRSTTARRGDLMAARLEFDKLAPEGLEKMRALGHYLNTGTGLEPVLLDLVRLRASLMNGCEYCNNLHSDELRKLHEPEERIRSEEHTSELQSLRHLVCR